MFSSCTWKESLLKLTAQFRVKSLKLQSERWIRPVPHRDWNRDEDVSYLHLQLFYRSSSCLSPTKYNTKVLILLELLHNFIVRQDTNCSLRIQWMEKWLFTFDYHPDPLLLIPVLLTELSMILCCTAQSLSVIPSSRSQWPDRWVCVI